MLLILLIGWTILLPAIVVGGLYASSNVLGRRRAAVDAYDLATVSSFAGGRVANELAELDHADPEPAAPNVAPAAPSVAAPSDVPAAATTAAPSPVSAGR